MLSLIFSFLLTSRSSLAVEFSPAVSLETSVEADIPFHVRKQLPEILRSALLFVYSFPPIGNENNLFDWSADRQILRGKTVRIILATSKNHTVAPIIKNVGLKNLDSITIAPLNQAKRIMPIKVILLMDQIFYDSDGRERPDGFSRLVLSLAHQIYGNVQHFLEFDLERKTPQTRHELLLQERKSFMASIAFLLSLKENENFGNLSEKTRDDLMNLLPSELKAFRAWQKVHPSLEPDAFCESMLVSIAKMIN